MSKQTINTGTDPGNLADGDTLRDAFTKTNANFDELYTAFLVTDTTLAHDDPTIDGTIAKALQDAGNAGGGTVLLGPGTFNCPSNTLTLPANVVLRGTNRHSSIVNVTGTQVGITLSSSFTAVQSLKLHMPFFNAGDGILATKVIINICDVAFSGGTPFSWAIKLDAVNIGELRNLFLGEIGTGLNELRSNGIKFQNANQSANPFNFGDSTLSHIDIWLASNNTTGIMFHGPDNTDNVINNVLLSRVEIQGSGPSGGCIGVHLRNSRRIVLLTTDIENVSTAIFEEHAGSGVNFSVNNVFLATFANDVGTSYQSSGTVRDRTFIGCDNIAPDSVNDTDAVVPRALWLNDGTTRLREIGGFLQIDDGNNGNGIQFSVLTDSPAILPTGTGSTNQLTLGRRDTRGVECTPGVILAPQSVPMANPKDGTLAYFDPSIVGPNGGLYHFRQGSWIFIG